jgi:hypothetical protein
MTEPQVPENADVSMTYQQQPLASFCAEERLLSLKCSLRHKNKDDKNLHCAEQFDQYKECKKLFLKTRNHDNNVRTGGT